jgi:hypothetical protein
MALFYSISQCLFLVNFCYIWLYYMQIICSFRTWGVEAGLSTTRRCVDPASLDRKDRKSGYQHVSAGNQYAQNLTPPQPQPHMITVQCLCVQVNMNVIGTPPNPTPLHPTPIYLSICLSIYLSICLSIYLSKSI